jgi:hypothetical protein
MATLTAIATPTDRHTKAHVETITPIREALARREALQTELLEIDRKLAADLDVAGPPPIDFHTLAAKALARGDALPARPTGRTTRDDLWERRKIIMGAAGIAEAERRRLVDAETVRFLRETARERHALAAGIGDALSSLLEATRRQDAYRASVNERGFNMLLLDLTNAFPSEHLEMMVQQYRSHIGTSPKR